MDVKIMATKGCSHSINLSKMLNELKIAHTMLYAEDETDLCQKLAIRTSPNLLVDGEVIYRRQPTEKELHDFFNL